MHHKNKKKMRNKFFSDVYKFKKVGERIEYWPLKTKSSINNTIIGEMKF